MHTVSSFVLPVLPPRSQKSICGFLERMLYFWEWCPEHASFRVILESQRGDNKIFLCCNLLHAFVSPRALSCNILILLLVNFSKRLSFQVRVRFSLVSPPPSPPPLRPLFILKGITQASTMTKALLTYISDIYKSNERIRAPQLKGAPKNIRS